MIGIIGALEEEVITLKNDMTIQSTETIAGCEYARGILDGHDIVITSCGMGKVNAASCTAVMIEKYHPDFILNTGVGGSLDTGLNVLDIAIASDVVQHDYNLVPLGYERGQVDNFDSPYFICDEKLNDSIKMIADKFGYHAVFARFATGDEFIENEEDKIRIVGLFDAKVCDMETGSIAQVCKLQGVRFAAIRTISDSGSGNAEQFMKFLSTAATHSVNIIEELIRNA